jgi:hypothetical protein
MLKCNIRGIINGYPLLIEANDIEIITCDYNEGKCFIMLYDIIINIHHHNKCNIVYQYYYYCLIALSW